jgi:hypothetical protein
VRNRAEAMSQDESNGQTTPFEGRTRGRLRVLTDPPQKWEAKSKILSRTSVYANAGLRAVVKSSRAWSRLSVPTLPEGRAPAVPTPEGRSPVRKAGVAVPNGRSSQPSTGAGIVPGIGCNLSTRHPFDATSFRRDILSTRHPFDATSIRSSSRP